MIYKLDKKLRYKVLPLFEKIDNTLILTCIQGHMGEAWVDNVEKPTVAQLIVGGFVFYEGDYRCKEATELLNNIPKRAYVVVERDEWKNKIENFYKNSISKEQRYAFVKKFDILDYDYIKSLIRPLPKGYELNKLDKKVYYNASFNDLSQHFTNQFESIEDYLNRGIGYCITHNGKAVCGASSYSIYNNGIEIQIYTHKDYRKKGLATITAAALIVDCLHRGIYPSWDAANMNSVKLAKKLGYMLDKPYDTYYVIYER